MIIRHFASRFRLFLNQTRWACWKHKIRDFPKEFLLVIFVKHLTVHFQFHENKPLELGELSTYSAPRSAVTALLLSWRRGRNQNLLYMKVQSIRRPIINSKVKKASLNIHYTVHCGCFGLLDTDNIINQLQSLGRSVIATIKLLAKSFLLFLHANILWHPGLQSDYTQPRFILFMVFHVELSEHSKTSLTSASVLLLFPF